MNDRRSLISVICPVFNESDNIVPFYDRLVAVTEDADYNLEILFIDDGSTDDSRTHIKLLAARDPRIRLLRLSRNFGNFSAVIAGLDHAAPLYVICQSGGRSARAADELSAAGLHAVNVLGGTGGWVQRGWPVEK